MNEKTIMDYFATLTRMFVNPLTFNKVFVAFFLLHPNFGDIFDTYLYELLYNEYYLYLL